jgi:nitrous oxidase accessory protein NosD
MLLFLISTASAATLDVGPKAKYNTIQKAVDAAKNGDTIRVAPGTYKEKVKIDNKTISLIGTKYPTVYGFGFESESEDHVEKTQSLNINGFKISRDGVTFPNSLYTSAPITTVRNNYFLNCNITLNDRKKGISVINNQFLGPNAGIRASESSYDKVTGNKFINCEKAAMIREGSIMKLSGNTFTKCGNGVYANWAYFVEVSDNKFSQCQEGLGFSGYTEVKKISANSFTTCGTGLSVSESTVKDVVGNTFSQCKNGLYAESQYNIPTFDHVTKNTFTKCDVGVTLVDVPIDPFTGNKYINNKKNIKIIKTI